jgi:hypothetical protein
MRCGERKDESSEPADWLLPSVPEAKGRPQDTQNEAASATAAPHSVQKRCTLRGVTSGSLICSTGPRATRERSHERDRAGRGVTDCDATSF